MKIRPFIQDNEIDGLGYESFGIEIDHWHILARVGMFRASLLALGRILRDTYGRSLLHAIMDWDYGHNYFKARLLWFGVRVIRRAV